MAFSLLGFLGNDLAMDLGTANTLIFAKGRGIVVNEPSVVAIRRSDQEIVAFGAEAKEMVGRTPGEITTVRPLRDGVIADFELAERMIRHFVRKVQGSRFVRPRMAIAIPSGITEVEKRAVRDSAEHAGAREVYMVDEPMAAAVGVGLPVEEPVGSMVVDVGGGTTEIAVISLSGIVTDISIRIAGDEMNESIIRYLKRKYNLLIGENMAEQIKVTIGSVPPHEGEGEMTIKGRDIVAGIPKTVQITWQEMQEALSECMTAIVDAVKLCLERTPPELSGDILDRGVILTGGGALLKGLDERLRQETGLPVFISDDPLTCVVRGTGAILENLSRYEKVLTKVKRY